MAQCCRNIQSSFSMCLGIQKGFKRFHRNIKKKYFEKSENSEKNKIMIWGIHSLVLPVSLSLLQTLVIFPRSANINHQGTEISQPLSVLPHLGAWEKARFFQNDGLTECKITRFMLLPLTLLKMR